MVRGARGDRVGRAAGRLDVGDRLLPALLEADPEARGVEPHVGAHQAAELDVADAVVDDVGPVDPALLHEHAAQPGARPPRPRPGACGWTGRRRSRRACRSPWPARRRRGTRACASCCRRTRARCCSRRASPTRRPAEVGAQALEPLDRRGPNVMDTGERVKSHAETIRKSSRRVRLTACMLSTLEIHERRGSDKIELALQGELNSARRRAGGTAGDAGRPEPDRRGSHRARVHGLAGMACSIGRHSGRRGSWTLDLTGPAQRRRVLRRPRSLGHARAAQRGRTCSP